jgi:hypothetical protein
VVGGARAAVLGGAAGDQQTVAGNAQILRVVAYPWTFLRRPTPTVLRM